VTPSTATPDRARGGARCARSGPAASRWLAAALAAVLCAAATGIGSAASRPAAARLPGGVAVEVTGNPADPDVIREGIRQAILRATAARRGSQVIVGEVDALPLRPGEHARIYVPVTVRHPEAAVVSGGIWAVVTNVPMDVATPARLLVSNRPETVTANGVLFEEALQPDESVRLLYHHRNGAATRKVITVTLANPADMPATVFLMGLSAGPSSDVMYAGHAAAARFVRRLAAGQGLLVDIPGRGAHTVAVIDIPPGALVTGLLQAQLLRGARAAVSVHIRSPWLLERTVTTEVNQPAVAHPRGVFRIAEVRIARSVRAGERVLLTDLGAAVTPDDPSTGERLRGDYGILYRLAVTLDNPLDRPVGFEIVAQALNGPARGMLLIAGSPVDFGLLRPGDERVLTSIDVAPQQTRTVEMLTMPAAGSFYPVALAVQSVPR
jgi:hypothetical protein